MSMPLLIKQAHEASLNVLEGPRFGPGLLPPYKEGCYILQWVLSSLIYGTLGPAQDLPYPEHEAVAREVLSLLGKGVHRLGPCPLVLRIATQPSFATSIVAFPSEELVPWLATVQLTIQPLLGLSLNGYVTRTVMPLEGPVRPLESTSLFVYGPCMPANPEPRALLHAVESYAIGLLMNSVNLPPDPQADFKGKARKNEPRPLPRDRAQRASDKPRN